MRCEQFRLWSDLGGYRGQELDHTQLSQLEDHRTTCAQCQRYFEEQNRFEKRVHTLLHDVQVPEQAREKLKIKLRVGVRKHIRVRVTQILAVAASLMLAVGVGYKWRDNRAKSDIETVVEQFDPARGYQAWLDSLEYDFNPEVSFNSTLFVSQGSFDIRPQVSIPSMVLLNKRLSVTAHVLIVPDSVANLQELMKLSPSTPLLHSRILRDKSRADLRYLVLYTGPSLEAFLEHPEDI